MKKRLLSVVLLFAIMIGVFGAPPVHAEEKIVDVTKYSYTVMPILAPFTYYLYVKTDNPDPTSFRLVDQSSEFYDEGDKGEILIWHTDGTGNSVECDPGTYYILQEIYPDVVYEDESIYRVNGGYVFTAEGAYSDGGEFVLLQKTESGRTILHDSFEQTDITVPCQTLETKVSYLIDTCTSEDNGFFENLDAVQARLEEIAVYPRMYKDRSKVNEKTPYPMIIKPSYPENSLSNFYNMYEYLPWDILTSKAYPFVLSSLGFPSTMIAVARELEPECTYEDASLHWMVNIIFDGEEHAYGGAGEGERDPVYADQIEKHFTFEGKNDFCTNGTIEGYYDYLRSLDEIGAANLAEFEGLLLGGATFQQTFRNCGGSWISVYGGYSYIVPLGESTRIVSDAWVDGRYIGDYETLERGAELEDHPHADIVVPDMTFTDRNGDTYTQDVIFAYDYETDDWRAPYFYSGKDYYSSAWELPEEFILTQEEAQAYLTNENKYNMPNEWLIYDGTAYPGTSFEAVHPSSLSITEEITLYVGENAQIEMQIEPSDATNQTVHLESSDPEVAEVYLYHDRVYAREQGTAIITAYTEDGNISASCTVTVTEKPTGCDNGEHSWNAGFVTQEATCTQAGVLTYTCTLCGAEEYDQIDPIDHEYDNCSIIEEATCTSVGTMTFACTMCNAEITQEIPMLEHEYDSYYITKEATCTSVGTMAFVCTLCNNEITQEIPMLEHEYDSYYIAKEATCTSAGTMAFVCTLCNNEITQEIPMIDHVYDECLIEQEPTCTEAGLRVYICTMCEARIEEIVPAAGHCYAGNTCVNCSQQLQTYQFSNVDATAYYAEAVNWAASQQITTGTSATTFSPNAICTRAQVVTFLWRSMGSPAPKSANNPFQDVKKSDYFFYAVLWAVENGITTGTSATTFSPNAGCTRAQVVTFLHRSFGSPKTQRSNPFTDAQKGYYVDAVLWAVDHGITTGMSKTSFAPESTCSRAQIVTFLFRAASFR